MSNLPPIELPDLQPEDEVTSETLEHPVVEGETSLARLIALQALYEVDVTGHPIGQVLNNLVATHNDALGDWSTAFLQRLVQGVIEHRQQIDDILAGYAHEFPIQQVAVIDRNILRIAVLEFLILEITRVRVAINEAVEMAKRFGAEGSARFVNGVLGAVARGANMGEDVQAEVSDAPLDNDDETQTAAPVDVEPEPEE